MRASPLGSHLDAFAAELVQAGYCPTNLISITDGQIYVSPELFRKGVLPAVDAGKSVSRVGGKAQLPAYREIAGDLRLTYPASGRRAADPMPETIPRAVGVVVCGSDHGMCGRFNEDISDRHVSRTSFNPC